jgi:alkylation response protein AidB-like acyl-CoA dehydrogenase
MNLQSYQRLIIGYHGCDAVVADRVLRSGEGLLPSENEYDWLGKGIYFWEHGPERAWEWAKEHHSSPAVVGALIHLGTCFDLLDSRNTAILGEAFVDYQREMKLMGVRIPKNRGGPDRLRRDRDCALLNWLLKSLARRGLAVFQTVRGTFQEGGEAFPGSGIHAKSHIQVAVRDPACIIGYFRPSFLP